MWGQPLDYPRDQIPDNFLITEDRDFLDQATAVVFHLPSLPRDFILGREPVKKAGQLWIAWMMECEAHYPLTENALFKSRFDLTMTYHQEADIRTPYIEYNYKELLRNPPRAKDDGDLICAFISSEYDKNGRAEYLGRSIELIDVHSYGKLFQNRIPAADSGKEFKMDTMSKYKFAIAFENASARDYVTEKFYHPLIAGSVPVYLGAPNINDFAPGENCFINAADFNGPEALAQFLLDLSRDEGRYNSYLEWKQKPFRASFTKLLEQTREHAFVRLCRKVEETLQH